MIALAHRHIEAGNGPLSLACVDRGIISYLSFIEWVEQLPYKRNSNRADYSLVIEEECGACSTKNAVVRAVAIENSWDDVQLFLGIYKMSAATNPVLQSVLDKYELTYIPEAHTYLKINGELRDVTGLDSGSQSFTDVLIKEEQIVPDQIGEFKVNWHKDFINEWAQSTTYSADKLREIREECIEFLQANS